jgi:hypothetical protein
MKITRLHISVFLLLAIVAWAIALYFYGMPVTIKYIQPFGVVVGFLSFVYLILEYWLWAKPLVHGWFVQVPDIRGTWKVSLQSTWVDPETGKQKPPIICYMGIEQSLSKLQMHLMTPESESWLLAYSICISPSDNGYQIAGIYSNKPEIKLRSNKSPIHHGSLLLYTHGLRSHYPKALKGEYWTDRNTTGSMLLESRTRTVYTRFEDAEKNVG